MFLVNMSLKSPYTIIAMALAIILLGGQSLSSMNVSILPRIPLPEVEVLTIFPGMNVYNTEMEITEQMERIILQAPFIRSIKSNSLVGISMIQVRFKSTYSLSAAVSMVTALVYSSMKYLPPGIFPPIIIPFGIAAIPIADLVLSSKELTQMQMYDIGYYNVRSQMGPIPGVAAPPVFGGLSRQTQIYVNNTALLSRGLTIWDVASALNRQNIIWPAGYAKVGSENYNVFVNALLGPVKTINDVPIKVEHGQPVYIKDIGVAKDSYRIQTNPVLIDGRKSVYIPVLKQAGANTIKVIDATRNAINSFYGLPKSLNISLIFDQSVYIRDSVASLEREGLVGILLTASMILIFLGNIRSTFIIITSIPLSLLVGFVMLNATGQTINIMTLGGLALAIGRLVDDAIVVLENTNRHLEMGKAPAQAALDGAGEVAMPVMASTIATMIVFSPVLFLLGKGKYLFTPLAAAVAYSMMASYFVSMTLVPVLSAWFLKPESAYKNSRSLFRRGVNRFNDLFDRFKNLYRNYLKIALRHRAPVSILIFLSFIGSFFLFARIGSEYFPPDDTGAFIIQMRLPDGSRQELTLAVATKVDAAIRRIIPPKDIEHIVANVGVRIGWDAMYTTNLWTHMAFILVQLNPSNERKRSVWDFEHDLRPYLASHFPNVEFDFESSSIITQILAGSGEAPIDIQILGPSYRKLGQIAHDIAKQIRTYPGTTDVRVKQNFHYPAYMVDVDRSKAQFLGVSEVDAERSIITSLVTDMAIGENFWVDQSTGNPYFLTAQYPEDKINSMDALSNILVRRYTGPDFSESGAKNPPIYLRDIADFHRMTAPPAIFHYNVERVVDVLVNVNHDPGVSLGGVGDRIDRYMAHYKLPHGYAWRESGMLASMHRSFGSMGLAVLLAMALVYLALVAQFQSFLDPFIIMMSVPFGLIGVFAMLYATGTGINVESLIGVIMDIGIGVSNSVLLVEFAIRLREQGAPLYRAVVEAGATRLRPILMTAIGTILAMIPTAVGMGVGSSAEEPLARAVIGGLLVMTVLTLVQVPIFFVILHTWEAKWKARRQASGATP
jgi:multidrug efflux pump subunit AcrB